MTTRVSSLLHDIEECFQTLNQKSGQYPRTDPRGLTIRAYEVIMDLDQQVYGLELKLRDATKGFAECTCWRELDDNDDLP
jgi:hypothetical protein